MRAGQLEHEADQLGAWLLTPLSACDPLRLVINPSAASFCASCPRFAEFPRMRGEPRRARLPDSSPARVPLAGQRRGRRRLMAKGNPRGGKASFRPDRNLSKGLPRWDVVLYVAPWRLLYAQDESFLGGTGEGPALSRCRGHGGRARRCHGGDAARSQKAAGGEGA